MRKILIVALLLFALAPQVQAIGTSCAQPGGVSGCTGASNPPYSGNFCINLSRQDSSGAWVQQIACNCLVGTLNNIPTACRQATDCCPTFGCDANWRCGQLAGLGAGCNPDTQNCASGLYCNPPSSGAGGPGTCIAQGGQGSPCAHNYACASGFVCGITGTCALPYSAGAKCNPSTPEDNQCAAGLFCNVSAQVPGKPEARCASKLANGKDCDQDSQCTSGRCWNPPGAILYKVCMDAGAIAKPNSQNCYSHAECYSQNCTAFGVCKQFLLGGNGTICANDWECITEKCDTGACRYRQDGEDCGQNLQCEKPMECIKDWTGGTSKCGYPDAGSDPVIAGISASGSGNGYAVEVKFANLGRDATNASITLDTKLLDMAGNTVSSNSVLVPAPIPSGLEVFYPDSVSCPQDGFYTYKAELTDVEFPRLNISRQHSKVRESASVPLQCGGCAKNQDWLPVTMIALLFGVGLVAAIYMAAYFMSSQGMKTHALEEIGALLVTAILLGILVGGMPEIDRQGYNVACGLAGGSCPSAPDARALAFEVVNRNTALVVSAMDMGIHMNEEISRQASKSGFCSMLGVGLSVGGCSSWGVARGPVVQTITAAGFASADQYSKIALLTAACSAALPLFLPLGIVLRSLRFTRGAGNFIIAMSVALYVVFPIAIVAADGMVNQFFLSSVAKGDPKFASTLQNVNSMDAARIAPPIMPIATWENTCDGANPQEDALKKMLDNVNDPRTTDATLLMIILRGPFETLFAIAVTLAAARGFAQALGTEIEVSQLARLS